MSEDYTWDETVTAHGYAVQNAGLKRDNATLAQRVMELERENAAATKLLDSCQKFLADLDTDDWPAGLDYAIRHFKRQVAGEISWDESSDQTLRRELTTAMFGDLRLSDDDPDAPLTVGSTGRGRRRMTRPRQRQDRSRRSGHAHSLNTQDHPALRLTMQQRAAWKFCQVVALMAADGEYYDMLPPSARMATDAVKSAAALLEPSLRGVKA